MQPPSGLHLLRERSRSFNVLSNKHILIVNVKYQKDCPDRCRPDRKQSQRPMEWNSPQETKKQRRVTQRREESAYIADNKDEKHDKMGSPLTRMVRPQVGTDK